jgi:hypothetical protein
MTNTKDGPEGTTQPNLLTSADNIMALPAITFVGQPLMFIAIDASAMMPGGVPLSISWTPNASTQPTSRIIKPPLDWQDRPRDDEESAVHGLKMAAAIKRGEPLQLVAKEAFEVLQRHRLVSVLPGLDRLWLSELFQQTTLDPCLKYLSFADLALKIAEKTGLNDESFAKAAIHDWFRVFKPRPAAQRVQNMAGLGYAVMEATVAKGLVDPTKPFEIDG